MDKWIAGFMFFGGLIGFLTSVIAAMMRVEGMNNFLILFPVITLMGGFMFFKRH